MGSIPLFSEHAEVKFVWRFYSGTVKALPGFPGQLFLYHIPKFTQRYLTFLYIWDLKI